MEVEQAGVGPEQVPKLDHAAAWHVVTAQVEAPDAGAPYDALQKDVDGVAGEATVGEVEEVDLVSASEESGEGVVDWEGMAVTL